MGQTSKGSKSYYSRGRGTPAQARRPYMKWVWVAAVIVGIVILALLAVNGFQQNAGIQGVQYFSGLTFNLFRVDLQPYRRQGQLRSDTSGRRRSQP